VIEPNGGVYTIRARLQETLNDFLSRLIMIHAHLLGLGVVMRDGIGT
jgi:hypothetical protein